MASLSRRALWLTKDRAVMTLPTRRLSYPREPLTQPVSGLSVPPASSAVQRHQIDKASLAEVRVTELENGLRVASQEAFGQYSTIGGRQSYNSVRDFMTNPVGARYLEEPWAYVHKSIYSWPIYLQYTA